MLRPSSRARSSSRLRSARQTSSHPMSCCAIARHRSGPTPAGSPEVSAIRGSTFTLHLVFDVSLVPQPAAPQLRLFVRLAGPDLFGHATTLQLVRAVELPAPEQLDDVPAVLRSERLTDLIFRERGQRFLELRNECPRSGPSQIAPFGGGSWILGGDRGDCREI